RITTSNLDLRAHLASGASISMFCASLHLFLPVTANYLPVMAKSSPGYCPVPRAPCTANFTQAIVIKKNFPAKTGPETANSPCFLPVIREYQGESGRRAPNPGLILPSSLPSKLGWSPGDLRCVNALARLRERVGVRVKLPMRPLLHPFLVNGRSGDPALYVETLFEKGAIMFDLGDISDLSPRKILRLEHVFVSHAHIDHFFGFDRLLRFLVGRDKVIRLFGTEGFIAQVHHKLAAYRWNL